MSESTQEKEAPKKMPKLIGKLIIRGNIVAKTGLHVGGSKSSLDIGGITNNIIKTPKGVPYIPGSSLKGKMRSLLGKLEGNTDVDNDSDTLKQIFGIGGDKKEGKEGEESDLGYTRLIVRDSFLDEKAFNDTFDKDEVEMELPFSDAKWENRINRLTGSAGDPRQMERVPAGARFKFEMVYSILDDKDDEIFLEEDDESEKESENKKARLEIHLTKIRNAMLLLQDDYIGGNGSRGYGQIAFENVEIIQKEIKNYEYKEIKKVRIKELDEFVHILLNNNEEKQKQQAEESVSLEEE